MANMRDLAIATVNLLNLQVPGGHTYDRSKPAIPDDPAGHLAYETRLSWLARTVSVSTPTSSASGALEPAGAGGRLRQGQRHRNLRPRRARCAGHRQAAGGARGPARRNGQSRLLPGADWIPAFPETFRLKGIREKSRAAEEISFSISEFSRPVVFARVQPDGTAPRPPAVSFFGCHLKSKGGTDLGELVRGSDTVLDHHYSIASTVVSHARRMIEAGALRAMLDARMASVQTADLSPTVVLGDLNDATLSVSTELITGQPSYRIFAKSTAGATADKGLYTVETLQEYRSPRDVYYTDIHKNQMELLDHIRRVRIYDHSRKRHWSFRELEVWNDHQHQREAARGDAREQLTTAWSAHFDWNPMVEQVRGRLRRRPNGRPGTKGIPLRPTICHAPRARQERGTTSSNVS